MLNCVADADLIAPHWIMLHHTSKLGKASFRVILTSGYSVEAGLLSQFGNLCRTLNVAGTPLVNIVVLNGTSLAQLLPGPLQILVRSLKLSTLC